MNAILERDASKKPYQPFGACHTLWRSARRQVVLDGPANTGKSRGALEKVHYCLHKYPMIRGLMVRVTRKSLTHSGMVTYELKVLPDGWLKKRQREPGLIYWNTSDQQYEYPNGSIFAVAGLDDPQKIMSSEWDMIYFQQAEQGTLNQWEMLDLRMRNHRMPYQQLIGDVNPSFSHHWMKQQFEKGNILHLVSRHTDNPALTPEDIAALEALTGLRRLRYYLGIWASAEGVVYEEWDSSIHIVSREELRRREVLYSDYSLNKQVIRHVIGVLDFGWTNPGVIHLYGIDSDGRLYLLREVYQTQRTIDWWIAKAREFDHTFLVERWIADPSRPDYIAQFNNAGLLCSGAINSISLGISFVRKRLQVAGDGRPRLFIYEFANEDIDSTLEEAHKPTGVAQEFELYVWAEPKEKRPLKEEPIDEFNHGLDCLRYMASDLDSGNDLDALDATTREALLNFRG